MKNIAIITARGGSKRIPRKNIKNFMGKPMITYAIDSALKSEIFDEVMVSTDDIEIAEISKKYGAKVPFMRSEKTANDTATTFDVIDEVINCYKNKGMNFDNLCCIYPCVPFLSYKTLKEAYLLLENNDGVLPVCKYPVPIEWAMKIKEGILVPDDRNAQNIRSQDIEPKYFDVGMFYFCKVEKIYENNSLFPNKLMPYIIEENQCQDIDTPDDWKMAELKYIIMKEKKSYESK